MDAEAIDQWYDEKKEKLTEKYHKRLVNLEKKAKAVLPQDEKKIDELEISLTQKKLGLKKDFLNDMDRLHKDYESKSKGNIDAGLRAYFFWHRVKMILSKIKLVQMLKEKFIKEKKV